MVSTARDDFLQTLYNPAVNPRDTIERRSVLTPIRTGYVTVTPTSVNKANSQTVSEGTSQVTWSARDPFYKLYQEYNRRHAREGSFLDHGHSFYSETTSFSRPTLFVEGWRAYTIPGYYREGVGYLYPSSQALADAKNFMTWAPDFGANLGLSFGELWSLGATGIARSLPNVPPVSVFQILGELREGLGRLPGYQTFQMGKDIVRPVRPRRKPNNKRTTKKSAKTFADEYMNMAFGVSPTVRTVTDLIYLASHFDEALKKVTTPLTGSSRRNRLLRDEVTTTTTTQTGVYPSVTEPGISAGTRTITTQKRVRVWCELRFDYRPAISAVRSVLTDMLIHYNNRVLGFTPNVEGLYELVPYSWLLDYFSNMGSLMRNLSYLGQDGVGLSYGYVMAETSSVTTTTWAGTVAGHRVSTSVTRRSTVRQRAKAHPLGFGLKTSLNASQWAILAAMGISRRSF